jgi:hypothetical protein
MRCTELAMAHMEFDTCLEAAVVGDSAVIKAWQVANMDDGEADGIYGPKTGTALWKKHQPTAIDIVDRALNACLAPTGDWPAVEYSMRVNSGMGEAFFGVGPYKTGDCSDFAAHCMGLSKQYKGKWYGTDGIVSDARGYNELYEEIERKAAAPGDLVVYPSVYEDGERVSVGHVGVIVQVDGDIIKTVDCSSTSARTYGTAIAIRDRTELWDRKKAIIARPVWL